ncbi:probable tubulin polyglutamylase ttll-15 isoform X2 [Lineus longissimus]|uniref:probable tubulin polyglutamylase ttll-15 isoform X2 n=1 Tax=Lineus longissimus TaxID=88925 RepID=UPI002B4D2F67
MFRGIYELLTDVFVPASKQVLHDFPHHTRVDPAMGRRGAVVNNRTLYIVLAILVFGIMLTLLNVYELRHMQFQHFRINHGDGGPYEGNPEGGGARNIYWVDAKNTNSGYLKHVFRVLESVGYRVGDMHSQWTLMWSHEYPFGRPEFNKLFENLKPHQRINKFPSSGSITNKNNLATSALKNIPIAFKLPGDKNKFLDHAKEHPSKLWVQKSNGHRGIKIKSLKNLDLTKSSTFVQEYIANPYLIDGRKFDIGLYVTMTSVDPLRVYVYDGDFLIRFCPKDYHPFNAGDVDKYVVGDDYTPTWEIPSLKKYYDEMKYTFKETFRAHVKSKGEDFEKVMKEMYDTIRDVYVQKEKHFIEAMEHFKSKENFFEMVRFDFVLDDKLNVYLMEVNMSPNLSSNHFKPNALLYEQVLLNLFSVVGLAKSISTHFDNSDSNEMDMSVSERDIQVLEDMCASKQCYPKCTSQECAFCHKCLTSPHRYTIKKAFLEHVNKQSMKRLFPPAMTQEEAKRWSPLKNKGYLKYNAANKMMYQWFRGKCLQNIAWCQ